MKRNILLCSIQLLVLVFIFSSCKKDEPDPRLQYVGDWNFKGTQYYFSGYYIYNPNPTWTYTSTYTYDYDDSTGSVSLGNNPNELIIKYSSTGPFEVYNLDENGAGKWTLSKTDFFHQVVPEPPGYSPSYTTYKIEGWKL